MSNTKAQTPIQRLIESETKAFALNDASQIEILAYRQRLAADDHFKANELGRSTQPDSALEQFRQFLIGGRYDDGLKLIHQQDFDEMPEIELTEWQLERSRLSAFLGDHPGAVRNATVVVQQSHHTPSRISAHLIRAHALFEQGDFIGAQRDLRTIRGLLKMFPGHPCSKYLQTLEIRVLARSHSSDFARQCLNDFIFENHATESLDLDALHVFLRVAADLETLHLRNPQAYHHASAEVASLIGDELYRGLDLVGLWSTTQDFNDLAALDVDLKDYRQQHPRIHRLWNEIQEENGTLSTTAATLVKYRNFLANTRNQTGPSPTIQTGIKNIGASPVAMIFLQHGFLANLEQRRFVSLGAQANLVRLLELFRECSQITTEQMWSALWPELNFNKLKHDSLIRNTLSRFRKITGLPIQYRDGKLTIPVLFWIID